MKAEKRKRFASAIRWGGTILSTALFLWLVSRQDWSVLLEKAAGISPWAILGTFLIYWGSYGFNTLRWCLLLWFQDVKITFWQALKLNFAGYFASQFLPGTIGGDGFRMLAIYPYTESKTLAIGSVALDRIINMSAMACLVPLPVWMFGSTLGKLMAGIALPGWLGKLVERYAPKVFKAFETWSARPQAFLYAFLAAWPSNLLPMAATYLIARQLGMDVTYGQVVGIQTVAYFISLLPISVNGYGIREMTFTTLYAALGVPLVQASALALVTRFLMVLATLPGALWLTGAATGSMEE